MECLGRAIGRGRPRDIATSVATSYRFLAFSPSPRAGESAIPDPRILVDADACPVKDEVVRVAERLQLGVVFVSNGGLRPSRDPLVRIVVVPQGADAADDWIVANVAANDVVVTADVPLANRCVALGAHVIGPTGKEFSPDSVGMALAMRNLNQHLRETGESKGYNREFTQRDRSAFLVALDRVTQRAIAGV